MLNELANPAAPGTPIWAASCWVDAILRHSSLAIAWRYTEPEMREDLSASWLAEKASNPLLRSEDPDALVEDLASLTPQRPLLWHAFDISMTQYLRTQLDDVDLDTWCWATDPRPLGVDLEGALLLDAGPISEDGQPFVPLGPRERPALAFIMRLVAGEWLVSQVSAPASLEPSAVEE